MRIGSVPAEIRVMFHRRLYWREFRSIIVMVLIKKINVCEQPYLVDF